MSLKYITSKKENKEILNKYLQKYSEEEKKDIIYELSYMKQEEKAISQDILQSLKNSSTGLKHPDFIEISKKIKETDMFMDKPFDMTEGLNECSKCKSKRTISYGKQNRSADEGMTVYVTCIDCKYRYTMSS